MDGRYHIRVQLDVTRRGAAHDRAEVVLRLQERKALYPRHAQLDLSELPNCTSKSDPLSRP